MNIELIEQLIDTKEFSRICEDAERGNRDAARFINKFMNELNILYFHLKNQSHDQKVEFQISKLIKLLLDYPSLPQSIQR